VGAKSRERDWRNPRDLLWLADAHCAISKARRLLDTFLEASDHSTLKVEGSSPGAAHQHDRLIPGDRWKMAQVVEGFPDPATRPSWVTRCIPFNFVRSGFVKKDGWSGLGPEPRAAIVRREL
jgi:hypothetical protein